MMSFSKDGNFQQSQHSKKYDKDDVPLTKGKAYYADEDKYEEYLKSSLTIPIPISSTGKQERDLEFELERE